MTADPIAALALELQHRRLMPWAVGPIDALPAAWERCDDALAMVTLVAHLHPGALGGVIDAAVAAVAVETPRADDAIPPALYAVAGVLRMVGPERAVAELRFALDRCGALARARVGAALCTAARQAVPVLTARDVVAAVSAR